MRTAVENLNLAAPEATSGRHPLPLSLLQAESLLRNMDPHNLVAPLRKAQASLDHFPEMGEVTEIEIGMGLQLQQKWDAWLTFREMLRKDTERGRDYLQQVRRELDELRSELERWPMYEGVCGYNPVAEFLQAIDAKERIERFLPPWLERREQQLASLTSQMEACARQNVLEHLL